MTTTAIIMMIVAILVIWGGLALAITNLVRNGDSAAEDAVSYTHLTLPTNREV